MVDGLDGLAAGRQICGIRMRALLAAALALSLLLAAAAPHVHLGVHGAEECAACLVRGGSDVARCQTPDVAPRVAQGVEVVLAPRLAPVSGAPLGAVPGQSPPAA
jgi:hypothetical protein